MRLGILTALIVIFATAGWAQQSNANSAAGPDPTATREPLTSPRPADWWDGDDPSFVNLITHPFARKPWVRRQVAPIRDRLNELEQITAENSGTIKDIDSRSQQGIQLASEKVNLADQHASDAIAKSQVAQTSANDAATRASSAAKMVANLGQYSGTAQTEIRFRPGQTVLSKSAKDALDQMAAPLKNQQGYVVEVRGFAPGQGQAAIQSSQKMAESVVRYLVLTSHIPMYRIYTMSLGNAQIAGEKRSTGPRVEVSVLKSDLTASAQQ